MGQFIIDMLNILIKSLAAVLMWLIDLLPDSPFSRPSAPPDAVNLSWITWVFDFPTWILHFSVLLGAIAAYYVIRVIARWIKVARG